MVNGSQSEISFHAMPPPFMYTNTTNRKHYCIIGLAEQQHAHYAVVRSLSPGLCVCFVYKFCRIYSLVITGRN